jgi:thioredoxin reductase (NADPH)
LFVAIGRGVDTDFIDDKVIRTNLGYIEADAEMKTNLDGVFVAGDIRNTPYRQIVCATGDGAIASVSAYKYVSKQKGTLYE